MTPPTKEHINGMEARLKPDAGDQTEKVILTTMLLMTIHLKLIFQVKRLTKETAELRSELAGLKAGLSSGKGEAGVEKWGEAGQVRPYHSDHSSHIIVIIVVIS